jgi:hypothetical protein
LRRVPKEARLLNTLSKTLRFDEPGSINTDSVIQAVSDKIDETRIKTVVVASSTGKTAIQFAKKLKKKAKIIAVSWRKLPAEKIQELKGLDITICDFADYLPMHIVGRDLVRNTFYTFGQGMKVCAEVVLIAVDKGIILPGKDVIAVGGTGGGADTAAIIKATSSADMFGPDLQKRLEIREIFALPWKKKWWK